MIFENPINKKVKKLEEQLNGSNIKQEINNQEVEVLQEQKEEIILPLNEILNQDKKERVEIELIDCPHNAIITNVPRNIIMTPDQLGLISIKYENSLGNINKTM